LREWHCKAGAAGVRERGKGTRGLPRNLGGPYCSTKKGWRKGVHGEDPETSGPVRI
jgi:hypothetical protein